MYGRVPETMSWVEWISQHRGHIGSDVKSVTLTFHPDSTFEIAYNE